MIGTGGRINGDLLEGITDCASISGPPAKAGPGVLVSARRGGILRGTGYKVHTCTLHTRYVRKYMLIWKLGSLRASPYTVPSLRALSSGFSDEKSRVECEGGTRLFYVQYRYPLMRCTPKTLSWKSNQLIRCYALLFICVLR